MLENYNQFILNTKGFFNTGEKLVSLFIYESMKNNVWKKYMFLK